MTSLLALAMSFGAIAQQSVGLVLSGGGAKGIAHIGVIQALEDNDIPIDYVAGTSMGAIVGGLYACGYTPERMLELIRSRGFSYWSTGVIDPNYVYLYEKSDPVPRMASLNLNLRGKGKSVLPSSLISPLPMNFAFMELFAAHTAQCNGDFNRLFVPFRCVTSDVYHKHKIVCSKGSVGDAIRASMTFPLVFEPIELDSVLVYDGGIYDNFPVDVMRSDFAPDIMIGVDVSAPDKKPERNNVLQQVEDMIIQNNDYSLPDNEGIKIRVPVQQFGILDFDRCMEIYTIGYNTAMEIMDSIKTRVTARTPAKTRQLRRAVFNSTEPYVTFDTVKVTGATPRQNDYLRYIFTRSSHDTLDMEEAKEAYYRAVTSGRLRNLVPRAVWDERDSLFSLNLRADVKNSFNLGFGGYVSSNSNSMMFVSLAYNTLSFNSFSVEADGWVGQSYMAAMLRARLSFASALPSYLQLQGVVSRHKSYDQTPMFYDDRATMLTASDLFGRLIYGIAVGRNGKAEISAGSARVSNRIYNGFWADKFDRDRLTLKLGQVKLLYEYSNLNDISYPTTGASLMASVYGVLGESYYYPGNQEKLEQRDSDRKWLQASLVARKYWNIGNKFSLGAQFTTVVSTQKLFNTYGATESMLPAFNPTASTYCSFNTSLRAQQYSTIGLQPVWMPIQMLQIRGDFHYFQPWRSIEPVIADKPDTPVGARYGKWFCGRSYVAQMEVVYSLPFAQLSAYGNYITSAGRKWNFGISFGLFFMAPRFLH
ncbi:MAG: patatin-like phospholipase family protein [Muribaculum sp.]|nr:patatin-like phospholipase family protein [Muribaculaceae bacterium]MCM1080822.1 patatin-like phospholipase family protein [Muribaculum sp.]